MMIRMMTVVMIMMMMMMMMMKMKMMIMTMTMTMNYRHSKTCRIVVELAIRSLQNLGATCRGGDISNQVMDPLALC